MENKEREIEDMAKVLSSFEFCEKIGCSKCENKKACWEYSIAEQLANARYGNVKQAVKDLAKELKQLYNERVKEYTNWDGNKVQAVSLEWLNADIDEIVSDLDSKGEEE